jgi:hypothetical protein
MRDILKDQGRSWEEIFGLQLYIWMHRSISHECYTSPPSHPPWFEHANNICQVKWSCLATTMQSTRWWGVYLLLILDVSTRWGWVVSFTPLSRFTPRKWPPVPIGQGVGWASEPVEEKCFASGGGRIQVVQSVSETTFTQLPKFQNDIW